MTFLMFSFQSLIWVTQFVVCLVVHLIILDVHVVTVRVSFIQRHEDKNAKDRNNAYIILSKTDNNTLQYLNIQYSNFQHVFKYSALTKMASDNVIRKRTMKWLENIDLHG